VKLARTKRTNVVVAASEKSLLNAFPWERNQSDEILQTNETANSPPKPTESAVRSVAVLVWTDSVSDGSAHVENVVRTERVGVVIDPVISDFRTDEGVMPEVVTKAGAGIDQKAGIAGVAGSKVDATAGGDVTIKARVLKADSAQHIEPESFTNTRLVVGIEGIDDRPVGLGGLRISALIGPPRDFIRKSDAAVEDDIRAHARVKSASLRTNITARGTATGRSAGRHDGSEADHGVSLLRERVMSEREKGKYHCKNGELSQRNLLE
jgi:hypothetical protein